MKRHIITCFFVFSLSLALTQAKAENVYWVGNSVTDTVQYYGFEELSTAGSHNLNWGRQMIPGAPLEWLWDHPDQGFSEQPYGYPPNAFPNYDWDVISLQPYDRSLSSDFQYCQNFINLAFQRSYNSTNTRVFIMARWSRNNTGLPYQDNWLDTSTGNSENRYFFEQLHQQLEGVYGQNRIFFVPIGEVMFELDQMMRAGQVPGFTNVYEIYADEVHLNNYGQYLTALTYYACVYRETPVGLPVPSNYDTISNEIRDIFQNLVWNVVRTVPQSGVPSPSTMLITTNALAKGYMNAPYSGTLSAVGGTSPRTWTIASGTLPTGITLGTDGTVSGTPTADGSFTFTARVTDSGTPALVEEKQYTLVIELDTTPSINQTSVPNTTRGNRYLTQLTATGGNGDLSWTVASGTLPAGVTLNNSGLLSGTPIAEGTFNFTVQVSDADMPADTDSQAYSITVGPPNAETISVSKVTSPMRMDGDLAETVWNLVHSADTVSLGTSNNTTTFGTLWDDFYLYVAVKVTDSELNSGDITTQDLDSIELFLDAYHDGQTIFNAQHRQIRVDTVGNLRERGGRDTGIKHAVTQLSDGYAIEIAIPWSNLGITAAENTVIGMDIACNDADTAGIRKSFQTFASADPTNPNPSQFGHAIMSANEVSGTGGEPPVPIGDSPICYEPFAYTTNDLHLASGTMESGFNGTWEVEGGTSTQYDIQDGELTYYNLSTLGRIIYTGSNYGGAGRYLDLSGAFAPWVASGKVGKDGTTLWVSFLAESIDGNMGFLALDSGGGVYHSINKILTIGGFSGEWGVQALNGAQADTSGIAIQTGRTDFIVARITFGATDTVDLFVNPSLDFEPTTPDATISAVGIDFDKVVLKTGYNPADSYVDEIRFGVSYSAVAPAPAAPLTGVDFSPLSGTYASSQQVTMSTDNADAEIRYTLDGAEPTSSSTLYTGSIQVSSTTTIRARAFLSGLPDGPLSGATYQIGASTGPTFTQWLTDNGLPTSTTPDSAPPGDNSHTYLMRYLFQLPATGNVSIVEPTGTSGMPYLEIMSDMSAHARVIGHDDNGYDYYIETSTDMTNWSTYDLSNGTLPEVSKTNLANGVYRSVFQKDMSGNEKSFIRFRAESK